MALEGQVFTPGGFSEDQFYCETLSNHEKVGQEPVPSGDVAISQGVDGDALDERSAYHHGGGSGSGGVHFPDGISLPVTWAVGGGGGDILSRQ